MAYKEEIVKVAVQVADKAGIREAARLLGIGREAIGRWLQRIAKGLPTHFKTTPRQVRNRTGRNILKRIRRLLESRAGTIETWAKIEKKTCIRTVQRWKAKWFPPIKEKIKSKRYERQKLLSLGHTDWGTKRINGGKRCCFTFYEDDASRRLYATKAYPKADEENTQDAFCIAYSQAGFKEILSDCGKVYQNSFMGMCRSNGTKSIHTRPYNPKCNGKAEAVVKKIKRFMSLHEIRSIEHANELLRQFEHAYNRTPHSSLKYKTPLEVFKAKQASGLISGVA